MDKNETFEYSGFLGKDIINTINQSSEAYKTLFDFCKRLNLFAQSILQKLQIHNQVLQELIISSLYIRLLSNFQACILLAQRGMAVELKVISRNLLETEFRIGALSKNKENVIKFVQDDANQRQLLLKHYNSVDTNLTNPKIKEIVNNVLKDLNNTIEKKGIKRLSTRWFAEQANLLSLYQTYYAILCRTVHPCIGDIQNDFIFDKNDTIVSINIGPNFDELEKILFTNCTVVINSIDKIIDIFQINIKEQLILLKKDLESLTENVF